MTIKSRQFMLARVTDDFLTAREVRPVLMYPMRLSKGAGARGALSSEGARVLGCLAYLFRSSGLALPPLVPWFIPCLLLTRFFRAAPSLTRFPA